MTAFSFEQWKPRVSLRVFTRPRYTRSKRDPEESGIGKTCAHSLLKVLQKQRQQKKTWPLEEREIIWFYTDFVGPREKCDTVRKHPSWELTPKQRFCLSDCSLNDNRWPCAITAEESVWVHLLCEGFAGWTQLDSQWTFGWTLPAAAEMWRSGFCCLHKPVPPITEPPWLYNVFMADTLAASWGPETKTHRLKGWGKPKGKRERREGGKELEVLNGVPRIPSAKDSLPVIWAVSSPRLAQAHSWILTSPPSPAPSLHVPTAPTHLHPPPSRPRQWIKELVYTQQKSEQCRAEGRHFLETVANNSGELVSMSRLSGSKAGNWSCIYLHCKPCADKGVLTARSSSLSSLANYSSDY